jgi:hypothetical protein
VISTLNSGTRPRSQRLLKARSVSLLLQKPDLRKPVGKRVLSMSILTGEDAILQGPKCTAAMTAVTRLPGFVRVHCESVEILPDFDYVTSSDYLSHLGTYSSKAEGRIQDVRVTAHQDKRHLNEHTDIQQTQGSSLHKDHPKLFRLRKVEVSRSHAPRGNGIFSPGRRASLGLHSNTEHWNDRSIPR